MKEQSEHVKTFNATHPLTYFEIEKYYENEHKFNGFYSGNNLSKIENGAYIINLDVSNMNQ